MLSFKDSAETAERGATVLYLVTEPCKPLRTLLQELGLKGQHRSVIERASAWLLLGHSGWPGLSMHAVFIRQSLAPCKHAAPLRKHITKLSLNMMLMHYYLHARMTRQV